MRYNASEAEKRSSDDVRSTWLRYEGCHDLKVPLSQYQYLYISFCLSHGEDNETIAFLQ